MDLNDRHLILASAAAQAAYANFSGAFGNVEELLRILREHNGGTFPETLARSLIGSGGASSLPFQNGIRAVAQSGDLLNGFSATVFRAVDSNQAIFAIRGTNGPVDLLMDAKLGLFGFANDQAIALYRYYKMLITPDGQTVSYAPDEILRLNGLNSPFSSFSLPGILLNEPLDASLALDRGLGILNAGEKLVVTGHSLGGHLASLFGRLFPMATDLVYTFNAPGVSPWGDKLLRNLGIQPNRDQSVTNLVAAYGPELASLYGTRPGLTGYTFIEDYGLFPPWENHSIVRLVDSLVLQELFAQISPVFATQMQVFGDVLAATTHRPEESLERAVDMLGHALGAPQSTTPIAVVAGDLDQRQEYYAKLYALRDQYAGAGNWSILSLTDKSREQILAMENGDLSLRHALAMLAPFVLRGGEFEASLAHLSQPWIQARAEFLSILLGLRTTDQIFDSSGSSRNFVYADVDLEESLSLLNPVSHAAASLPLTEVALRDQLGLVDYDRKIVFGSDRPESPDSISGAPGSDRLFGQAGNDTLVGLGGDDLLEDGSGADLLMGGSDIDTYLLVADADIDRILDADGKGSIRMDGVILAGGFERAEGVFVSYDGKHDYTFAGDLGARGTLTVDASLVIEDFLNGDLGIYLTYVPDAPAGSPVFTYHGDREDAPGDGPDDFGNWILTGPEYEDYFDVFQNGRPGNTGFETGGGNDYAMDIHGGNDLFRLGGGEDYGSGGDGDDWLEGGNNDDLLIGGEGNDYIVTGTIDEDIEALSPPSPTYLGVINMNLAAGGGGEDTVVGSAYAEYLEGGASADILYGGAGGDVITGDGDFLVGAEVEPSYPDYMWPGSGYHSGTVGSLQRVAGYVDDPGASADTIFAGSGNDQVDGGSGADMLFGGPGRDLLMGGLGNDELHADLGIDTVRGGDGDDLLVGSTDGGVLEGDAGNDTLVGASMANELRGGSGADVHEGSFTGYLGDGDIVRFSFGNGQSVGLFADGAPPTGVTVELGPDVLPGDVVTRQTASGEWELRSTADTGAITFIGDVSQWVGLSVNFADGTVWQHSDFAAHADTSPPVPPLQLPPLPGAGEGGGEGGGPAPNPNDNVYYTGGAGRQTISDYTGTDRVIFLSQASDDVSVFRTGSDMLLRYEGGEVRLAGQFDATDGIEAVTFGGDGVTWDRATLASNAVTLPETQSGPLGVEVVAPGAAFSFTIGEEVFANEYAIGETYLEVTDMQGAALPSWLDFDAEQGTFSGTPAAADAGVTAVLVALRDESGVVAVTPLVVAVDAGDDSGGGGGAEEPPPSPAPTVVPADEPVQARLAVTVPDLDFSPAFFPPPPASFTIATAEVGAIDDPVYRGIERLLSSPALLHAPAFLDRYEEAVREFRARHPAPEEEPVDPLPTDEEMARYNTLLHAWLDADQRRQAAIGHENGWDGGGAPMNYFHSGGGIERVVGGASETLARPGLPALPVIHQPPGLREGLVTLGG